MAIKEKMLKHIQEITGNDNADLWTLRFNENDANVGIEGISFRGVTGNIRMQEGYLRTNDDVKRDNKKVLSNWAFK